MDNLKKIIIALILFSFYLPINLNAQETETHQLKNWHIAFSANEHIKSRFLDRKVIGNKEFVTGKKSSYDKSGDAKGAKMLWPYAEYRIKSKVPGGRYTVSVHYRIDKKSAADQPKIELGMDHINSKEVIINNKLLNIVKASFDVKFLKGKQHTVKIWFPSQGVEIHKIEVNKALFK